MPKWLGDGDSSGRFFWLFRHVEIVLPLGIRRHMGREQPRGAWACRNSSRNLTASNLLCLCVLYVCQLLKSKTKHQLLSPVPPPYSVEEASLQVTDSPSTVGTACARWRLAAVGTIWLPWRRSFWEKGNLGDGLQAGWNSQPCRGSSRLALACSCLSGHGSCKETPCGQEDSLSPSLGDSVRRESVNWRQN